MSERMYPIPFNELMNWITTEYATQGEIFGIHKAYYAGGKSLPIFGESDGAAGGSCAGHLSCPGDGAHLPDHPGAGEADAGDSVFYLRQWGFGV